MVTSLPPINIIVNPRPASKGFTVITSGAVWRESELLQARFSHDTTGIIGNPYIVVFVCIHFFARRMVC